MRILCQTCTSVGPVTGTSLSPESRRRFLCPTHYKVFWTRPEWGFIPILSRAGSKKAFQKLFCRCYNERERERVWVTGWLLRLVYSRCWWRCGAGAGAAVETQAVKPLLPCSADSSVTSWKFSSGCGRKLSTCLTSVIISAQTWTPRWVSLLLLPPRWVDNLPLNSLLLSLLFHPYHRNCSVILHVRRLYFLQNHNSSLYLKFLCFGGWNMSGE